VNVNLTPDDLRSIDEVTPHGVASGERCPEHMMALVNG
jgi:hypothetical protein